MIYLASPYSHQAEAVREFRFKAACRAAATMMSSGKTVFSPIAHSHHIAQYGLPLDWSFWERQSMEFLRLCEEVVVLAIDGWSQSVGVQAEIKEARLLGKPITFIDPDSFKDSRPGTG